VTYVSFYSVPIFMHKDNPNLRVIFLIRDPVSRLVSHHSFIYNSLKRANSTNLNTLLAAEISSDSSGRGGNRGLWELRRGAVALLAAVGSQLPPGQVSAAAEAVVRMYYSISVTASARGLPLILHSIYYPGIQHWSNVFGMEKILLVRSEKLHLPSSSEPEERHKESFLFRKEAEIIYKFLDICPYDKIPNKEIMKQSATAGKRVKEGDLLTEDTRLLLVSFLQPFVDLMEMGIVDTRETGDE
jgi:hypothetical protein